MCVCVHACVCVCPRAPLSLPLSVPLYTRKGRRHDNRHPNKQLQQAVAGTAKDRDGNIKRQRQKAQVKRQTGTAKDRDRRQKLKKAKVKGGNKSEKSNAICMEAGERKRHAGWRKEAARHLHVEAPALLFHELVSDAFAAQERYQGAVDRVLRNRNQYPVLVPRVCVSMSVPSPTLSTFAWCALLGCTLRLCTALSTVSKAQQTWGPEMRAVSTI